MDYFPIFMNLQGRTALLVGGTEAAAQKARLLLRAGSTLQVVAEPLGPEMDALIDEPLVSLKERKLEDRDLDDVHIVIAASADDAENKRAAKLADAKNLPYNVVDQPADCSFIMPAFVDRSPVMVAISSGGASPVLARLVRAKIEALLPQKLGVFAALAQAFREQVMRRLPAAARRRFWEDALEGDVADRALPAISTVLRTGCRSRSTPMPASQIGLAGRFAPIRNAVSASAQARSGWSAPDRAIPIS